MLCEASIIGTFHNYYTGPFDFDTNLLPRAPGALIALDALGNRASKSRFCLEKVCVKLTNYFLKASSNSYTYRYLYIYLIYIRIDIRYIF